MRNKMSAVTWLCKVALDGDMNNMFKDFTSDEVKQVLDHIDSPDFGTKGNYTFFCNGCNKSWSFDNKLEKKFMEKLHKLSGCAVGQHNYTKQKDFKDTPEEKRKPIIGQALFYPKSDTLSYTGKIRMKKIIETKEKEETNVDSETLAEPMSEFEQISEGEV